MRTEPRRTAHLREEDNIVAVVVDPDGSKQQTVMHVDTRPHCVENTCVDKPYGPCLDNHMWEVWVTLLKSDGRGGYDPDGDSTPLQLLCGNHSAVVVD